tara:strand:+ start:635 stop:2053 length:1419 start_codon:yes stop_codon:yes gene_type:complete
MIEHSVDKYEAVQKYPILRGYLEHFRQVSKDNEIPGLLSFFFIQGQAAIPYVRIPIGGSNIDPRVNVFWIQDTRTGKSVAFETIQKVMVDAGMESMDYTTGTDAAMLGSFNRDSDGEVTQTPGALAGRKGINFDEGSILLKPNQHSEETVLFLQSALNAAGTGRNILTKHMKDGTIKIKSDVSLWITTFPPKGIKEHVLDKGIFQRVLLYWRNWTLDMKRGVAHELAKAVYNQPDFVVSYDEVVTYFKDLESNLTSRLCKINGISNLEWMEADEESRESYAMNAKNTMFSIDDSYRPALAEAIDTYYDLVENMDPSKQSICSSFIMGLQNYTNIIAHHMAMLEGVWVVTGEHIDMAKEILYDLYHNLIHWLESEVKVGMKAAEMRKLEKVWKDAYFRTEQFDFEDGRGPGWVLKKDLMKNFGRIQNISSPTATLDRYVKSASPMMENTKEGRRKYVRLKPEHRKKSTGDKND